MTPTCDGWCERANPVTHIGSKGYAYCAECALRRRQSSAGERTRKLTIKELRTINEGHPLDRY
jgi:hypothetical protein